MIYTLIKNNIVVDNIIADQEFIDTHYNTGMYDVAIEFTEKEFHPGIGWSYDPLTGFSQPVQEDN